MALGEENGGGGIPATMLVGPAAFGTTNAAMPYPVYMNGGMGGNSGGMGGFGGDGWGIIVIILILAALGGFGNNGGGNGGGFIGNAGVGLGYDFPWLLNGQNGINNNVSDGFRDAQLHDSVTSVRDGVSNLATQLCDCCGNMQMSLANSTAAIQNSLCNGFSNTAATITGAQNAISNQLYNNEIASLNRSFAEQTANTAGFTATNTGIADLKYTIASEACADRAAVQQGIQTVLDKLCALELDSAKREAADLRTQLNMAQLAASQTAQNAFISQGFANEVDALYNRLNSCPVPTTPVYGRTPIFTCNNNGCGCGNNIGGFNGNF